MRLQASFSNFDQRIFPNAMEDDEDDFFAYQTAKSLSNKRTQLKQFFQTPVASKPLSSSSNSESDDENDLIPLKKSKASAARVPTRPVVIPPEAGKSKDAIRSEIDAIVTSCFTAANKEVKRRIKLGKRTELDDQECEHEDEYVTHLSRHHRHGQLSRSVINALNKSQLEEDDEKVTRETAAYDRLNAVLRVTKPLCEKQLQSSDDEEEEEEEQKSSQTDQSADPGTALLDKITLKIDHSDGRQTTLALPSSTTLKSLYHLVADSLGLPSISLVFNNQTLKLDEQHQSMSLNQLHLSSDNVQFLESYPVTRKLQIFIQTSITSSNRRSSSSKREYTMLDTDRFESIFDTYKRDMKSTNIRFEFDGDTLNPRATPNDYEMVDGEILDAFILPSTSTNKSKTNNAKQLDFDEDSDN